MGLKCGVYSSKQQETNHRKKHHSTNSSMSRRSVDRALGTASESPRQEEDALHVGESASQEESVSPRQEEEEAAEPNIDFEGVQRGDAEMGNKLCRVINTCVTMGQKNPILHIFNQGAGGNSHIMKMIVECRSKESGCFNGA